MLTRRLWRPLQSMQRRRFGDAAETALAQALELELRGGAVLYPGSD